MSSPGPKPLVPIPPRPIPNPVQCNQFKTQVSPKGTWADTKIMSKSPITFTHEGEVPQLRMVPLLDVKKNSGGQREGGHRVVHHVHLFSEKIINLTCCTIIKMPASRVDKFSAGRTTCKSPM